jgi:hypothetical protein
MAARNHLLIDVLIMSNFNRKIIDGGSSKPRLLHGEYPVGKITWNFQDPTPRSDRSSLKHWRFRIRIHPQYPPVEEQILLNRKGRRQQVFELFQKTAVIWRREGLHDAKRCGKLPHRRAGFSESRSPGSKGQARDLIIWNTGLVFQNNRKF